MAEKSGHNKSTDELRAEIASSRERVSRDLRGLQYELDFSRKIRRSFREQTGSWITAAAAVGTLVVLLPVRKKKIYIDAKRSSKSNKKLLETGFALGALKIAASLIRPVVVEFVKNRLISVAGQSRRSSR
jgi:type IV secretory pathway component VirB8